MVQLTQWLLSWLSVSSSGSPSPSAVVSSCSDSTIVLANPEGLQVGDIFIRIDNDHEYCRRQEDDCSVLFREILSDEGNGVYKTSLASFSQVFPSHTFDYDAYKDTPVESVLPPCGSSTAAKKQEKKKKKKKLKKQKEEDEDETELPLEKISRRSLVGGGGGGPAAAAVAEGGGGTAAAAAPAEGGGTGPFAALIGFLNPRGKSYDDDYYYDDHYYDDDYYNSGSHGKGSYEDDYYYPAKKDQFTLFWEATKKFIYDVYCVIRQLDCSPYAPGGHHSDDDDDDDDDDYYYDDDYHHHKKSKKSKDHYRGRVRGLQQQEEQGVRRTQWFNFGEVASTLSGAIDSLGARRKYDDDDDDDYYSHSDDDYYSSDDDYHSRDDDLYDDDFFDDDYHYDPNGANFWQLLDAVCEYVASLLSIAGSGHDGGHYSKDKDKWRLRTRRGLSLKSTAAGDSSWWSNLFTTSSHSQQQQVPSTLEEWSALNDDGSCPYTLCSGGNGQKQQCFESQSLVSNSCNRSLDKWFTASPTWREDMDASCQGQDYCYASNIFGMTTCDEHFYQSLMKACPMESSLSLTLSSSIQTHIPVPVTESDLSEHCPLVSILLYSQTQLKHNDVYEATKETQVMFEASGCPSS